MNKKIRKIAACFLAFLMLVITMQMPYVYSKAEEIADTEAGFVCE